MTTVNTPSVDYWFSTSSEPVYITNGSGNININTNTNTFTLYCTTLISPTKTQNKDVFTPLNFNNQTNEYFVNFNFDLDKVNKNNFRCYVDTISFEIKIENDKFETLKIKLDPTFNLKTLNFSIFENKGSLIIKKYSETEIKQKQKLRFF
jgi:archaellin